MDYVRIQRPPRALDGVLPYRLPKAILAFDDELEVEKDMEQQRLQQQSFQQPFVSTAVGSQSQSEDLHS
jgi:hypothetical protein